MNRLRIPPLRVKDTDGNPNKIPVFELVFPNDSLTVTGNSVEVVFKELYSSFTNNTGVQIDAGDVVCLSTSSAGEIVLADADAIGTSEGTVGVALNNIAHTASGLVQILGEVTVDNNSVSFDLGKEVFISATAGKGTKTAPSSSGQHVVVLGRASDTDKVILGIDYKYEVS